MFVHGRHTHSQYCSLASTKASQLKFWNETKFHFLLTSHFIDTLDQALSLSLSLSLSCHPEDQHLPYRTHLDCSRVTTKPRSFELSVLDSGS